MKWKTPPMGIRHLGGLVLVAVSVLVGSPSAPAAVEREREAVAFPPNAWVQYCDVQLFVDVNAHGDAIGLAGDVAWIYHLPDGTRSPLHAHAAGLDITDSGLVVGSYASDEDPATESGVGFVQDITTGEFTVVDPGLGKSSRLVAVTEEGLAVGNYRRSNPDQSRQGVFTYDHRTGEISDLGAFGTGTAEATDISGNLIVGSRGRTYSYTTGFVHDLTTGTTSALRGYNGLTGIEWGGLLEYVEPAAIEGDLIASTDENDDTLHSATAVVEDRSTGEGRVIGRDIGYSAVGDMNADLVVVGSQEILDPVTRLSIAPPQVAFAFDVTTGNRVELEGSRGAEDDLRAVGNSGLAVGRSFAGGTGDCPSVVQLRLPPHAPTGASVGLFGKTALVSWVPPDFDGYDPDLTYVLRLDGVEVARVSAPLTSVAIPDTPCAGGTYTVTAENAEGSSAPSEGAVLVARSCTPATPAVPVPATPTFTA